MVYPHFVTSTVTNHIAEREVEGVVKVGTYFLAPHVSYRARLGITDSHDSHVEPIHGTNPAL